LSNGSTAIDGQVGRLHRPHAGGGRLGRRGALGWGDLGDISDEAKAFAHDRADQALILPAIPDYLARRVDMAGEGGFGDDTALPDVIEQVILADDARAIFDKVGEQIEDLRPYRDRFGLAPELATIEIKRVIREQELHRATSSSPGIVGR
jgi:hypothetical protein